MFAVYLSIMHLFVFMRDAELRSVLPIRQGQ